MASVFAHAVVGAALWPYFRTERLPRRAWVAGALLAAVPDVDVLGFGFGIAYGDPLGHRGLTHSLLFAAFLGAVAALALTGRAGHRSVERGRLWAYLALATASHGVLDAMTTGGSESPSSPRSTTAATSSPGARSPSRRSGCARS